MRLTRALTVLCATALAAGLSTAAGAADAPSDYNLFVLDKADAKYSSVQGKVAVGGNAAFTGYSIGAGAAGGDVNLVVGGNLKAMNGSTNGLTAVGGAASYSGWSASGLQPAGTALPVDFTAAADFLVKRAFELSSYGTGAAPGTLGTVTSLYGNTQWVLNGAASGLSIFNLDAAAIRSSNTFTINLTPGATALINVTGDVASLTGGLVINGGTASDVLWNFHDASSLSFSGISMLGSVLAPNADYLGGWGQVHGSLMVRNFGDQKGATSLFSDGAYRGDLLQLEPSLPVPEPATWLTMIGGLALVGAILRRRKAAAIA